MATTGWPDMMDEDALNGQVPWIRMWGRGSQPLPVRAVRTPSVYRENVTEPDPGPRLPTGPLGQPFDFCGHVHRLCRDITSRCPHLYHIDVDRLLFAVTQARTGRAHGLQARVTPLRFRRGQLIRRRHGTDYQVQRYFVERREMLYVVAFCLPRFLDQPLSDKFVTLFHELYHISPCFDGDLRRHDGRYAVHSHSKRAYDDECAEMARAYLAQRPDAALHAFLRLSFSQLRQRHGQVLGVVVPRPRLLPVLS